MTIWMYYNKYSVLPNDVQFFASLEAAKLFHIKKGRRRALSKDKRLISSKYWYEDSLNHYINGHYYITKTELLT